MRTMVAAGLSRVALLQSDPDLARGMDPAGVEAATRRLVVPVLHVPRGAWKPPAGGNGPGEPFALVVLDGVLVRETTVGDHPCAEPLGPGDVVRLPPEDEENDELLPRGVEWSVAQPARVALLDRAFMAGAAQWPEVVTALLDRAARRADRLLVLQAITHLTRVDDRLLALLWHLAERWGRVGPGGVALTLRLPHRTLAGMVGARRPSVTTAFGQLVARGDVERRADGAWVLPGSPPEPRAAALTVPVAAALGRRPASRAPGA